MGRRFGLFTFLTACGGAAAPNLSDASADGAADAAPEASTITITLGSCPALTPCGGDVTGTWKLTEGCIDDPLATSKNLCPTLVVNSETATASGTVSFVASIVTRSYSSHYAMDVTIPTACLQGATCAQAQTAYQAYIPNTTCVVSTGGCECAGSSDTTASQGTSYTAANNEIVTAGGDHYAYCVNGTSMRYRHTSGPTPELGSYTLTK